MKNILFLLLFLFPFLAFGQKKTIDGFLNIPFGSDSATVKATILAKGGARFDKFCHKDTLVFSNVTLDGQSVSTTTVYFVNNKAYDVFFILMGQNTDVLDYYASIVSDMSAIYGKPYQVDNASGYNNTTKIRKLQSGNISVQTIWAEKNHNAISVEILPADDGKLVVRVRYQDSALWDVAAAKRRSDL